MESVFEFVDVTVSYNGLPAVRDVTLAIPRSGVTALVGPSGSGKSTLLRCLNRMNDLAPGAHLAGLVTFEGDDIYAPEVDLVELRRRVAMVFQRPTAFPMSIFENVAYGPRLTGQHADLEPLVEDSLTRAGLWEEVRRDVHQDATGLSIGQQQRLSIARCLAVGPQVLLMDEPTASLDPVSTRSVESLVRNLADDLTIVLVTHDLGQAERVADHVAFLAVEVEDDVRHGVLVECGPTRRMFDAPADSRTAEYLRAFGR
jgi:phosphate transport system ATP-binding protein